VEDKLNVLNMQRHAILDLYRSCVNKALTMFSFKLNVLSMQRHAVLDLYLSCVHNALQYLVLLYLAVFTIS